ncbi:MAG: bifunctional proline dehydrogenase/L-glutamate gamma-semialdehyde dehydrogenase [Epsilonproteobacteria bacterium]|nr:bifunctional proline dehydrogenase/L-glutamate gamma-semialdehyde dehydrogenase [Campylobacterota bacterium]PIP09492.1 MAG: 1-pyrroline-5-carboxylate dehydrogenase [Sulfurimonas sp. CG23_combo_of_CG06-09_8_20_14_all_36_33]PIS27022.1 MAG: 1-pyrroline-5-carboxylate dehydrogenase [Sulfurimonas sp. CG08_land_8_20_14_0_20_36_33]PIU35928.1 MAG: 1-pyrroline-5-carboxylate dehydrogenase [Sulfurimonas sp. CG07_land_8_20_14_0_80_36_56]PIV04074.1 MAG: 1-pyrroline-5-carboxylate dehydrogenase [Sulfurimona
MQISKTIFESAKDVAASWQSEIDKSRESSEKKFHEIMKRMLKNPMNKIFLIELLDQSFRAHNSKRIANQLEYIFSKYKGTDIFSDFEELLVWSFRHIGIYMPDTSVELFIKYLRQDISDIVIKGEDYALNKHLKKRRKEHTRVNINIIGEMVLGEGEAEARIEKYIKALQNPHIDYISIKISTIFSQVTPVAHTWSVGEISTRLERIYSAAMQNTFIHNGKEEYKFVNLDMEEYRDINITIDAFMQTLSQKKFYSLEAGIVLQAYLPDTLENLKKLVTWAKKRINKGGVPIKIRLVKGANQEMELTESSLRNWPCVTYLSKRETDANFKILMDYLIAEDVAPYVHVGIASHNLFEHAVAMLLARERCVEKYCSAEMLEGMSETAYHVLKKEGLNVILYAPIATKETFTNAIAYLVRRFDENTAEENFLRHSFGLSVNSPAWKTVLESYDASIEVLPQISLTPFRTQDRKTELFPAEVETENYIFKNESDTDFALPQNREWAEALRDKWKNISHSGGYHASVVIGGELIRTSENVEVRDKSQYNEKVIVGTYVKASSSDLNEAVAVAKADVDGWRKRTTSQRQKVLMAVAQEFQKSRGDLIGIAAAEVGKVFSETDVEVSEAIDFLNFYPYSVQKLEALEGVCAEGKGVGLVVSPWNFPIAIPTGGIAAALAAGNTVLIKPSSDAVLCAYRVCQCFWDAGVSKNTLQFVPCSGAMAGKHLITNSDIDFVIFTGGETTAKEMILSRPDIHLSAETGGKDATIVTALADRDQAVKNIVASAFNNSGQKCSATSLVVLEREVYEDKNFKKMLVDAASSLNVGSVWELQNRIGSLVDFPSGNLKKALGSLDEGEEWALEPSYADKNPYMLKPAIRWGTSRGDFCHMNELFGPVLSVMCAKNLEDAIDIVNETGYGLTSGLESLDAREQKIFKERLRAGNLYINRMTTGAIVIRQPFGGMGKSAIGSGKKAGGFNYISQFMNLRFEDKSSTNLYAKKLKPLLDEEDKVAHSLEKTLRLTADFSHWLAEHFNKEHDYSNIRGESNVIRYIGVKSVLLRFEEEDILYEMLASIAAVKMVGARVYVSIPHNPQSEALLYLQEKKSFLLEREDSFALEDATALCKAMQSVERIRFLQPPDVSLYEAVAEHTLYIATEPFIEHGRIELMHYFIEQSISDSYHRYGNLGLRGLVEKGEN